MMTTRRERPLFTVAGFMIAISLSLTGCHPGGITARQLPPSASTALSTTATVKVSDGAQPVQIGSSSSALSLTLPAGALTGLISQLGPVNVTAQMVGSSSLTSAEQGTVQAGTPTNASLLTAVQLDVAAAGSSVASIKALHVQQATSGSLTVKVQLPPGTTCQTDTVIMKQVVASTASTLLGKLQTDQATHRQISGTAMATFGAVHLVFAIFCLAVPAGIKPKALESGQPIPAPSVSPLPSGGPSPVAQFKFTAPSTPFTETIPGAILTVTGTDFQGQEDQWFQASNLNADVANYDFDVAGTDESNDGQDQAATAQVTITGQGMHQITVDEELFPVESDDDNVLLLTDNTSGVILTVIADQELQYISILQGDQLSVMRAQHLTTKAIKAAATQELDITNNPDGTWFIDEQEAQTAQAAAQLVLKSPIGSGTSIHGLVALLGLLTNQQFLIAEPTLAPANCVVKQENVDTYIPPPNVVVNAHGEFVITQQTTSPNASASAGPDLGMPLEQLLQAIIQQMQQNLQTQRLKGR